MEGIERTDYRKSGAETLYINHDLKESIGTKPQGKTKDELQGLADDFMGKLPCESVPIQPCFDHPTLERYGSIND